jgi:hypothetical protein
MIGPLGESPKKGGVTGGVWQPVQLAPYNEQLTGYKPPEKTAEKTD